MSDKPVAVIEYNNYVYALQPVTLKSGATVQALRQVKKKSSEDIFDYEHIHIDQTLGEAADEFSITLNNDGGRYTDKFLPFQEIVIYVGFPTDPNNIVKRELFPIIAGLIDDADVAFDKDSGNIATIRGRNYAGLLLDNKITDRFHKMTASDIVSDIISKYGLGLDVQIATTKKVYNKIYNTPASAAGIMAGKVDGQINISDQTQSAIDKFRGTQTTKGGPDDWLYRNKTAWEAIENLAYIENAETGDSKREMVAYFDGRTFYFGPRRNVENDPTQLLQLIVGENIRKYKFKQSTRWLKTRVKLVSRSIIGSIVTKKPIIVTVPDDLKVPADITAQEAQGFKSLQELYGIREIVLQDRDKAWGTGIDKLKKVGIAKLKEYTRLTFTGDITFTFTGDTGNQAIRLLNKDRAVSVLGIEAADGNTIAPFTTPQSRLLNAIFYIEKASHDISKGEGYTVSMELSSRKPQTEKQLSNLAIGVANVAERINTGVDDTELQEDTQIND